MRQPTLVLAATSLFTLACLAGCEEQSNSAAERQIEAAVTTLNQAEAGFVRDGSDSSLQEYRLDTLEQAIAKLRAAIEQGDPEQQLVARRLLSDVHAAAAQAALRDAGAEDAALQLRAGSLFAQLAAYEHADARVERFDRDNALTLEQINEEIREQKSDREEAVEQRQQLEAELEELREQRAALRDEIDQARAEARELRDEAFVSEGEERYELEEEADQLELGAQKRGAEVDRLDGEIALAEADLALVEQRIASIDELLEGVESDGQVKGLESQVSHLEQQAEQMAEWHEQALAEREEAFEALQTEFEHLMQAYNEAVRSRFERAAERADQAAEHAGAAAQAVSGADRRDARAEQLARVSDQVRVRVRHAEALAGLGRVLTVVTERIEATQPDAARPFEEGLAELAQRQDRLVEEAEDAIASATELADELADGDDDISEYADAQQSWLERQQTRLSDSRLSS